MVYSLPVRNYSISTCDSAKILEVYGVLHYTLKYAMGCERVSKSFYMRLLRTFHTCKV